MITIADALIFAGLVGIAVFMWYERNHLAFLEQENDELWDNLSQLADEVEELKEAVNGTQDAG